ncbi:MAG: DUF2442 domain-containing protein [Planctomycetes bacterium]|nr:DUF2442 domain-containing protein [Planctomycetota bacterium]MBM4082317.1 DUF2442 domain-containing protein [Planctomycetota bacterium]MBM4085595.1 DUF2442 domain-containing protein [Planctomycetota bacterium]
MSTLVARPRTSRTPSHVARGVRFAGQMLYVVLADGREIGVPLARFPWLARASHAQRRKWRIEPRGFAVYWDDLDDGIEVEHLFE